MGQSEPERARASQSAGSGTEAPTAISQAQATDTQDILIYHYGIAWEAGDEAFQQFTGRKVLRFHNVTPPEFYAPYHSGIANACKEGLSRVSRLSADVAWCVSEFNVQTLRDVGWVGRAEVLPPFHRVESLLAAPVKAKQLVNSLRRRLDFHEERASRHLNLLFVGRMVPNKAIPDTIQLLDRNLPDECSGTLRIVGRPESAPGHHRKEIEKAIRECRNLEVVFLGASSEEKLKRELLCADALISLSRHEGFCVPLVEAMALGVPILTGNATALKNTLGDAGVFLEDPAEQLGPALFSLLEDRDQTHARIENGLRRYYSEFHPTVLESRLGALLATVSHSPNKKLLPGENSEGRKSDASKETGQASKGTSVRNADSDKIAIVVARFGEEFAGGSEKEALEYASLLAEGGYTVEVFTSCARSSESWANEYAPGSFEHKVEGSLATFRVHRFKVVRERDGYWHSLDRMLHRTGLYSRLYEGSYGLGLEWVRAQGPYCPGLLLALQNRTFDRILFMTYLYFPVLLGCQVSRNTRHYLVPTLHDEAPANLLPVKRSLPRMRGIVWNTSEEALLGRKLWKVAGGRVVGAPLNDAVFERARTRQKPQTGRAGPAGSTLPEKIPQFLYIGRWDGAKGTDFLLQMLNQYECIRDFRLLIVGSGAVGKLPAFAEHQGFVSEEKKLSLIEESQAVLVPSPMESFSIVTLEALALETPVIVNGENPVLLGHANRSQCALPYRDAPGFIQCLERAVHGLPPETLVGGRRYAERYRRQSVFDRLKVALDLD